MKYLSLILIFGLLFFGGCTEETKTGTNETGTTVKLEDYTYFFNENDTSIDPSFPCHYAGCGENGEGMYDIFEGVEEKGE